MPVVAGTLSYGEPVRCQGLESIASRFRPAGSAPVVAGLASSLNREGYRTVCRLACEGFAPWTSTPDLIR